jgi:sulfur-oxidizing protein SoxZ
MTNEIHKIQARMKDGVAEIKLLVKHPMETGNRKDPVIGIKIPRHFIREFRCKHNGTEVLYADWGWGVSQNPYLSFRLNGAKPGDAINATWIDNKGVSDSIETQIE